MFTHLQTHSYYTYGKGCCSVERLILHAKSQGYEALALTDLNTMAGVVEFYSLCKEHDLFPIIGAEIDESENPDHKAVLLCRNSTGYRRMCEIITARQLRQDFSLTEALCRDSEGLFVLSCDTDVITGCYHHVPDFYAMIVPIPANKKRNRAVYEIARRYHVPLIVTNDVYFDSPDEHALYRILASMKKLTTVYDLSDEVHREQYLKSPAMMSVSAKGLEDAMENTARIVAACQFEFTLKRYHCARYRDPDGRFLESSADRLRDLATDGLVKRYRITEKHKPINYDTLIQRLNYELEVISNLNFCDYFLICHDIVGHAHRLGYWHVGRGSAANSLVSYCLELTEVDPIRYNLYFERFLNYARGSPPDIDLDFNWRIRDSMLTYIYERYGQEHVAMLSSIHTLHARGALREVAKAFGISERELDRYRKFIPHTRAGNLEALAEKYPEARHLKINDALFKTILKTASRLDGFPHYSGIHASGIVVTEKPIVQYSALERSANGFVKTQLDMYSGEDIGLIKFDILAVRGLGTIEDAVRDIQHDSRMDLDIFNWRKIFSDEQSQELMSTGRTIGVVHAESPFIRNAMRITQARSFELLTVILGMVRTGCVESGMMYTFIERLLQPEKRKDALPALMEVLPETYGVMIFEEDVIKVLHYVGGLTLEEADVVRRFMSGKRVSTKVIATLRTKFYSYCRRHISDEKEINALWKQIESFSGFSFCKAHSASYALMAYQAMYLRIHYPAHYMAAVLSNEGGFYSPAAYVSECRRLGLTMLPPDINLSEVEYRAESNTTIRVGLRFIKGIPLSVAQNIVEKRKEGAYASLSDFIWRTQTDPEITAKLIRIGCFDFLKKKRTLLVAMQDAIVHIQKIRISQELFAPNLTHFETTLAHLEDMQNDEKLALEHELLGYWIQLHPLDLFPKQVRHPSIIPAKDLILYKKKKVKMIGWLVSAKRIKTRDKVDPDGQLIQEGQYMKFMTMEDLTGIYDTVIFPKVYADIAADTLSYGPFCIEGIVDERYNTVNVTRLALLRNQLPMPIADASITLEKQEITAKQKASVDAYDHLDAVFTEEEIVVQIVSGVA